MNNLNIKENCKELKSKFRQQYTNVTEEDLKCDDNGKDIMLENLQQKLGITGEDLNDIILDLS